MTTQQLLPPLTRTDRQLALVGAASVGLTLAALITRLTGVLPNTFWSQALRRAVSS